jgi:UDP-2-acetamido-3-amino-2,3-dideoxy-glucuronate N-acetyltransferase
MTERTSIMDSSFEHGKNFKIGNFSVIEEDVQVGDNVSIGHFCMLKSGTRFGDNVNFADCCTTTGICYVGNNAAVRTGSCISKSVIIEDKAFIGAGIMSSHTKHIHHQRTQVQPRQLITRIGYGAVIGSRSNLSAGVKIGDNVVIGYGSVVTKDVLDLGVYVGNPLRKLSNVPKEMIIPKPEGYKEHQFNAEMLKRYLPYYRGEP